MNILHDFRNLLVMPDLLTALAAAGLGALGSYLFARYVLNPVRVKRLRSSHDHDFDAFYELCRASFDEDEIEPKVEMARYLDDGTAQGDGQRFEDYFAVVKKGTHVCGLINSTIYPARNTGFINYMAVDENDAEARRIGTSPLLRALGRRMRKLGCTSVLYEIETLGSNLSRRDNDDRRFRAQTFRQIAEAIGGKTFQVPIDYVQPQLSLLEGQSYPEIPLALMYVALKPHSGVMTRRDIATLLDAVLLQWYLDIYDDDDENRRRYEKYLTALHGRLIAPLPDTVTLKIVDRKWSPPMKAGVTATIPKPTRGLSPARRRKRDRKAIA